MKQRLSLAAALLGDPVVLILDEPANGLDPQGIHDLRDLLRDRAARGHTVLVSSHLLGEVEHLVDDVVVIDQGRLVTAGTIDDLTDHRIRVRAADTATLAPSLVRAGADVAHVDRGTLTVSGLDGNRRGRGRCLRGGSRRS